MQKNKYREGLRGQHEAKEFLQNTGYEILAENYRVKTGEIDLIALSGNYLVFIEVKFRTGTKYGLPREAVSFGKQKKIAKTAMHYISVRQIEEKDFRFDVVEVIRQNGRMLINHIENAFELW